MATELRDDGSHAPNALLFRSHNSLGRCAGCMRSPRVVRTNSKTGSHARTAGGEGRRRSGWRMSNYALAFLANDRYLGWVVTFLESVRSIDAKLPLYCIPHSGPTAGILGLRKAFGFEILQEGLDRLDGFPKRLYPRLSRNPAIPRTISAI